MIIKSDYREMEFVGYVEPSIANPERSVVLRRILSAPASIVLHPENRTTLRLSQFDSEMKELEGKIRETQESWAYQKIINFDDSELKQLKEQYSGMQRIKRQMEGKQTK